MLETSMKISVHGVELDPVPKIDCTSNRKSINTLKRVYNWLKVSCIKVAEYKNDDWNKMMFNCVNINNISQSDIDGMNLYLFGEV